MLSFLTAHTDVLVAGVVGMVVEYALAKVLVSPVAKAKAMVAAVVPAVQSVVNAQPKV